jgi:sulfide:quinone oxidoreductase
MASDGHGEQRFRVLVAGGGVAAVETVLALHELAGERVAVTVIAPGEELVYRPMTVREPFSYAAAGRYPLAPIVRELGAELVRDTLDRVERERQTVITEGGLELPYDALVLALGAQPRARYEHALTIDDRHMDEALHGLVQEIEGGDLKSLTFLIPERMAWQLPIYELALMMAGRAYDTGMQPRIAVVTAEPAPLALFGETVSARVAEQLSAAGIETFTSSWAETPTANEVVVEPGARLLSPTRAIALPELYGPAVRGLPAGEHGFLAIDGHCRVREAGPVFAAGDATDFPVKHGGLGTQEADAAAEAIAALAGAPVEPQPFSPVVHAMLLTDGKPLYLTAALSGGNALSSEVSETPTWSPPTKIAARFLGPYLERLDREGAPG